MSSFEFATAKRILFGPGSSEQIADLGSRLGKRAFVALDQFAPPASSMMTSITERGMDVTVYRVSGEPSTESVSEGVALAREGRCDVVIAVGGGSVIDTGKAVAALLANGGEPLDYLEVVGQGKALTQPSLPMIAAPTTAGTGAEVTKNAVLKVADKAVKVSLRSDYMLPTIAVVDPLLTVTMPPHVTASTGLDALTQCLEPYVSCKSNPLTDAIAVQGLRRAARSLRRAYEAGNDLDARTGMALASLFGGLSLANARLGAVHGFAGVLGGMYPAPHGIVCARLLPFVVETNVRALEVREPGSPLLGRFRDIAQLVTEDPAVAPADGVAWIQALCADLGVPGLSEFGVVEADFPEIVAKSQSASSMRGNPLPLTDAELTMILYQAM